MKGIMKPVNIIYLVVVFIVMAILVNVWNRPEPVETPPAPVQVTPRNKTVEAVPQAPAPQSSSPAEKLFSDAPKGEVMKKSFVLRGTDRTENVFYKDGNEIARQRISPKGEIQQTGEIPDGRIKFVDEYNNTQGEENYINGKRFGESKTTYPDGKLKTEEKYQNDKLIYSKDYYRNGTLRTSYDYQDSRNMEGKEVGVGKLYYPDGTLKYEWNLTRSEPTGFKKSYNTDGTIRAETYFDERGNVIPNPFPPPSAPVPTDSLPLSP